MSRNCTYEYTVAPMLGLPYINLFYINYYAM